ncbi:hypothetical protein GCM10023237_15690 [Streptomyces coeruleoprunus]
MLFAATVTAVIGFQGSATAAATGWPTGCQDYKIPMGNGWQAHCSNSNGGRYKATVKCVHWDGQVIHRDAGTWVSSGPSVAFCPPTTFATSGGVWTRSY